MICIETSAVIFTLRYSFKSSLMPNAQVFFQRHHLYSLCVYISLLESRKIILIPEESIAKLQHRTVVQGA